MLVLVEDGAKFECGPHANFPINYAFAVAFHTQKTQKTAKKNRVFAEAHVFLSQVRSANMPPIPDPVDLRVYESVRSVSTPGPLRYNPGGVAGRVAPAEGGHATTSSEEWNASSKLLKIGPTRHCPFVIDATLVRECHKASNHPSPLRACIL